MTTTKTTTWTDDIPNLKIEANGDGTLTLEQDWTGNIDRVAVHVVHLRLMAERLGLIGDVSATEAELLKVERMKLQQAERENDRLKRALLRVHGHALALQEDFRDNADWRNADLSDEMWQINGLVNLLDAAVDDFKDCYEMQPTGPAPKTPVFPAEHPQISGATPPKTGGVLSVHSGDSPKHPRSSCTPADPAPPQMTHPTAQMGLEV